MMLRVVKGLLTFSVIFSVTVVVTGCGQHRFKELDKFGRTSKIGAATGGAIGAGVGAIIGNQTGDSGTGFVVGALAGTAAGGSIGRVLEVREERIIAQNKLLEAQESRIATQRNELDKLRSLAQDRISFGKELRQELEKGQVAGDGAPDMQAAIIPSISRMGSRVGEGGLVEKDITAQIESSRAAMNDGARAALNPSVLPSTKEMGRKAELTKPVIQNKIPVVKREVEAKVVEKMPPVLLTKRIPTKVVPKTEVKVKEVKPTVATKLTTITKPKVEEMKVEPKVEVAKVNKAPRTPECARGDKEVFSATQAAEVADKLFHYRRALRLCPSEPSFHKGLAEVYMTLDRKEDARYELKEALKLDPEYQPAKDMIATIK